MGRPVEDASRAQIGTPRRLRHAAAVDREPVAEDLLGDARANLPRRGGGQITQPRKALQMFVERRRHREPSEVQFVKLDHLAAKADPSGQDRLARADIARQRIFGHAQKLERITAPQPQRMQRRAPRQPVKMIGKAFAERKPLVRIDPDEPASGFDPVYRIDLGRCVHDPLSVAMFAA